MVAQSGPAVVDARYADGGVAMNAHGHPALADAVANLNAFIVELI